MTARTWLAVAAVAALAAALAGCQTPPQEAYVAAGGRAGPAAAAVPVGNNEAGEPCRYEIVASTVGGRRDALVYCGDWDQPSARVAELAEPADPGRLAAVAAASTWRSYVDQRFACGAPAQTRILAAAPAMLMQCTRRIGGWPHLALTADVGGRVFAADAVRPALPAVEATIAALTGQAPPPAATASGSEARRLIAQRGGAAAFGSGDQGRFFQAMRLGDAYNNIDDPVNAERHYRDALAIQQRILGQNDPGLALPMMKLAGQLAIQQSHTEADRMLARAAQLVAIRPDPLLSAQLDYYRAQVAAYSGRRDEALALVHQAETSFTRLAPDAAVRMRRSPGSGGDVIRGGLGSTSGRGRLASLSARGGGFESLVSDETPAAGGERAAVVGLAEAMRLRAALLQFLGRFAEAAELARRTQHLLDAAGLSVSSTAARSLRQLASNQAVTAGFPEAAVTSAEAGRVFERVVPGARPTAANLLAHGYYLYRSNRVSAALDNFRRAGTILRDPMVTGSVSPELILAWLDALEAGSGDRAQRAAEMFEAAQFARTGQTAQDITRATAALIADDPRATELVRSVEERSRQLDRLRSERIGAEQERTPPERLAALDRQIEEAERARGEAEAAVLAVAPRYRQVAEKPAPVAEMQRILAPDEALAFIFTADNGSYGFVVRPTSLTAYKIPLTRAEIAALVARLRDTTIVKPGGLPTPDFATSYRLYSALFGPAEQLLAGVARLTVATSGDLLRYPMEALVTQPGARDNNGDFRQVPFLLRRFALSYVPAPRILVNIRSGRAAAASAPRPFIGFGDFRPASAAQLAASFPPDRCGDDYRYLQALRPLPESRAEVTTIAQQLGAGAGDVVLGESFTKHRLAQPDLAQYRIILLATHGFFPAGRLRCLADPAITVSAPARAANADDAFERPRDIEKLKLNADLVALSACDTSGAQGGESLSGLARSFFVAGARGLLVTHWDVVSNAAIPLMTGTFAGGARDSAQALRGAQLRLIDSAGSSATAPIEVSHPNFWAAFVLIGDGVRTAPGV